MVALLIGAGNAYLMSVTSARRLPQGAEAPPQRYALVLGNRVLPGGRPSRELGCRLEAARQLYLAGRARRLIVSGRYRPELNYDEPAAMAAWLEARGVPASDVIADRGGYRTASSMADAAAIGVRSMLVVSQAYHLPRALYLARHAGIDAWGVPSCEARRNWRDAGRLRLRETIARVEAIVEVLLRGVRGRGPLPPPEKVSARRVANGHSLG
ncbi:MAG TPA: ElyC/SanA/YdcF family protein [Polyangia bacterium]|nr:ElyC/SanA/YdcF family protein [Polyangia bacterium]